VSLLHEKEIAAYEARMHPAAPLAPDAKLDAVPETVGKR